MAFSTVKVIYPSNEDGITEVTSFDVFHGKEPLYLWILELVFSKMEILKKELNRRSIQVGDYVKVGEKTFVCLENGWGEVCQ